jgi:uncharacterized protein (TIGR03437 family)
LDADTYHASPLNFVTVAYADTTYTFNLFGLDISYAADSVTRVAVGGGQILSDLTVPLGLLIELDSTPAVNLLPGGWPNTLPDIAQFASATVTVNGNNPKFTRTGKISMLSNSCSTALNGSPAPAAPSVQSGGVVSAGAFGSFTAVSPGMQQLTITTPAGTTAPYPITVNPVQPGLLAPSSFKIGGVPFAVALLPDGDFALPVGAIAGVTSRPARPGDILTLYGVGFGPVTPAIAAGQIVQQSNRLTGDFQMSIGGAPATLPYAGLAPGSTQAFISSTSRFPILPRATRRCLSRLQVQPAVIRCFCP